MSIWVALQMKSILLCAVILLSVQLRGNAKNLELGNNKFQFLELYSGLYGGFPEGHRQLTSVRPFPDLSLQAREEAKYLKFHKCINAGEVYSAAYLISKEHLIHQHTAYNLTWVNCEMGSFIMMNQRADPKKNVNGSLIQALDVLDFSVIHLSWFERLQRRHRTKSPKGADPIQSIIDSAKLLRERALMLRNPNIPMAVPELNRTVAIMPFLGSENGAGHSKLGNRLQYLHACFWSIYAEFPHVVAAVKNTKDESFARNESGLPFFDVMLIENLPKSASLPVATVQQTKARIMDGRWDFDYVYFTESDQILMMRAHEEIFNHLKQYPRRLMVPHRLLPYPETIVTQTHKRNLSEAGPLDWLDMNCCIQRQNCHDRKSWVSVKDNSTAILKIYGLQVALGNINFHEETLRACTLYADGRYYQFCP